jgi:adenosylcobinamide kinase/adenosylcobinamide-phosphate guanylyltransferase
MGKLIFITGGARSGKSTFAQKLANNLSKKVTYIATAEAKDKEMELRIKIHRKNRPAHWRTVEREKNVTEILSQVAEKSEVILLDCLTLLISNLLLSGAKKILKEIRRLVDEVKRAKATVLIVSNEVGMGIVPDNKLARRFRDIAGRANQIVAQAADEVYLVVSGISVKVKMKK